VGTAYLFSVVVMIVPGAFPTSFAPDGKVGIYFGLFRNVLGVFH